MGIYKTKMRTKSIQKIFALAIVLGFVAPDLAKSEAYPVQNSDQLKVLEEITVAIRPRRGRGAKTRKSVPPKAKIEAKKVKKQRSKPRVHSPVKATLLSLIPGLGQIYNKQALKGVVYFIATGIGIGLLDDSKSLATEALSQYLKAREESDFDKLFEAYEKQRKLNKIVFIGTASLFTINLVDAYFFGSKRKARLMVASNGELRLVYKAKF